MLPKNMSDKPRITAMANISQEWQSKSDKPIVTIQEQQVKSDKLRETRNE